uniref:3-dehydrosphinganine reductase n=1 Tax=Spumella elongata TaxID=89044 RepID=A0A7S3ME75_9STRA|mmetsp:Transcript_59723/g.105050  ORF Transcript_59723/g.105050 Transcript_59723/m.105050 type:complete len:336 (+) Transcript_59723:1-1008(+)
MLNVVSVFNYTAIASLGVLGALVLGGLLYSRKFDCKGKHVLITGGSSGIGLEVAKEYLRLGARVSIMARDAKKLAEAKVELVKGSKEDAENRVFCVSVDTGSGLKAVEHALAPATKLFGDVDVLINCAGTSVAGAFYELDIGEFERMLKVNVLGSVYPTRAVLAGMKKKKAGRIVFVASQVAQVAIHGYSAYGASKWALRGLAEALQMEVKPFGIYVSVSYPPDTDTPGYKEEMLSKPQITRALSESGDVFSAQRVAHDLVHYSNEGYFGISTGLDGWLLKQLHPGMSPANHLLEVIQQIVFAPLCRLIAVCYVLSWDSLVASEVKKEVESKKKK